LPPSLIARLQRSLKLNGGVQVDDPDDEEVICLAAQNYSGDLKAYDYQYIFDSIKKKKRLSLTDYEIKNKEDESEQEQSNDENENKNDNESESKKLSNEKRNSVGRVAYSYDDDTTIIRFIKSHGKDFKNRQELFNYISAHVVFFLF